ncbi:hypothetical protein [Bradyrhizobium macuxiense]|uniref:hypothetical protein n=1 Tax=Bradyrhizobium macuxiense TaxID=1755647 RepID=UPI00082BA437|nr:hypothetical protein [Bradyrhizobium macuxiense]
MAEIEAIATGAGRPLADRLRDVTVRIAAFYATYPEVRIFVVRHGAETLERSTLVTEKLLRPAYLTVRELFEAGIEAGIIRSSHPALFFALLNAALNLTPAFPMLLGRLAPAIEAETARSRLIYTTIATFLHLPPAQVGNERPANRHGRHPASTNTSTNQ